MSIRSLKINDSLKTVNPSSQNLAYGLQVVNSTGVSPYNVTNITGRTLVNLLGRDGNFESAPTGWGQFQATTSLATSAKAYGSRVMQITVASGEYASVTHNVPVKAGSRYVVIGELQVATAYYASIKFNGIYTDTITSVTGLKLAYLKTISATTGNLLLEIVVNGGVGGVGIADGIRVYEITDAEYTALNTMTPEQVAAKYPYVDDMKQVVKPYVIKYGENLASPFVEWSLGANTVVEDPYTLAVASSALSINASLNVPVTAGQQYTMGCTLSGYVSTAIRPYLSVQFLDGYGSSLGYNDASPLSDGLLSYSIVAPANAKYANLILASSAAGAFKFKNPIFNLGTIPVPFKPKADDYLFFPNVQLASNYDRTTQDTLYKRNGKYWKLSQFRIMELTGDLPWVFDGGIVQSGLKHVVFRDGLYVSNAKDFVGTCVKNNGKILATAGALADPVVPDRFLMYINGVHIAVANTDSGWGDNYTPSQADIQAYFYGWVMTTQETWNTDCAVYNGSGTKGWVARYSGGTGAPFTNTVLGLTVVGTGRTTVPTTMMVDNWKNYKLQYQLVTPTTEEIIVEGDITLHQGLNQIEVGNGMIVRERANPMPDNLAYNINNWSTGWATSKTINRVKKFLGIYKNGKLDAWTYTDVSTTGGYGGIIAQKAIADYDPTAAYTVTYLALDQYSLTSNVLSIQGEYSGNLKTSIDTLATNQADLITRVGVLENTKKQKALAQWIYPTLLNGWATYGDGNPPNYAWFSYTKDDAGWVYFRGMCSVGIADDTTIICNLPAAYRPKTAQTFPVIAYRNMGGNEVLVRVTISIDGNVSLRNVGTSTILPYNSGWLNMHNIKYKID